MEIERESNAQLWETQTESCRVQRCGALSHSLSIFTSYNYARAKQVFSVRTLTVLLVMLGGAIIIHPSKVNDSKNIEHTSTQIEPCLKFIHLSAGLTSSKQGESVALHTYMASDGTMAFRTYFYYRSPKKANKELRRKLTSAVQIIKHEEHKLNEKGSRIGARVVGIFRSNVSGVNEFEVIWTDGSDLNVIKGSSLQHVLQLEKPTCQ